MMLEEAVSDEEFAEAKDLPYREVCGVISYAAGCVKLEMRYSISVCGKHRGKWGRRQFIVLPTMAETITRGRRAKHIDHYIGPGIITKHIGTRSMVITLNGREFQRERRRNDHVRETKDNERRSNHER
jgi:hypothetical protein